MQKVILYIQPQLRTTTTVQDYVRVDLMDADLIELTQVIQDVKSIDKVFTDYSKTFNLPTSKTNNKIFKWWYNPDVEGFDNQIMANARIELNHFAFKEGKVKLESVTMKNGEPSLYKITFFGNTIKLTDLIGEDKLENLVWLNNFNHENSNANVKSGLEAGLDFTVGGRAYADAIVYPLIAHSQQYIYDATGNGSSGLNIAAVSTHHTKRGVFPEDLKPAILVKNIIKAIEEQYNITFKTGEFFNSNHVANMYMWLHRVKGNIVADKYKLIDDQAFTCASSGSICTHFASSGNNVYFNTSKGTYTFYDTESQGLGFPESFDFGVEIVPSTADLYTIEVVDILTDTVYAVRENCSGTQTLNSSFGNDLATRIPITINQNFELAARVKTPSVMTFAANIQIDHRYYDYSLGRQTISGTYNSNSLVIALISDMVITEQIPDIKVLDFLNGMFKMFNLTAYLNFTDEIVVKRLDDYFSSGQTHDITEYIKIGTHTVGTTIPYSEIDLEYAEPKSILAQRFLNTNNRKYGEVEYKTDITDNKTYKVTAPFEHMLYSRLNDLTAGTFTDVQTGCFLDEELKSSIGQPLLFYGIQRTGITTEINFVYTTRPETYGALAGTPGTNYYLDAYWMPHHANELGSVGTAPTYNLNFGSEIDTYNLTDYSGQNNSLFLKNYQEYITRIYNKKTRLYKYSAILPLKILLQLTLSTLILLKLTFP